MSLRWNGGRRVPLLLRVRCVPVNECSVCQARFITSEQGLKALAAAVKLVDSLRAAFRGVSCVVAGAAHPALVDEAPQQRPTGGSPGTTRKTDSERGQFRNSGTERLRLRHPPTLQLAWRLQVSVSVRRCDSWTRCGCLRHARRSLAGRQLRQRVRPRRRRLMLVPFAKTSDDVAL